MEKKYHPIVTFKSLIEEFLHRYWIDAIKERSHIIGISADHARRNHHWRPPNKRVRCTCGKF